MIMLSDLERELDYRDQQPATWLEWLAFVMAVALMVGPCVALWFLW